MSDETGAVGARAWQLLMEKLDTIEQSLASHSRKLDRISQKTSELEQRVGVQNGGVRKTGEALDRHLADHAQAERTREEIGQRETDREDADRRHRSVMRWHRVRAAVALAVGLGGLLFGILR